MFNRLRCLSYKKAVIVDQPLLNISSTSHLFARSPRTVTRAPLALIFLLFLCLLADPNKSNATVISFDFENESATALPRTGALSNLSITESGLRVDITRPGGRFDIVSNTGFQAKPANFGQNSLDPFFDTGGTPFILNFSSFLTSMSLNVGDYGQDTPDIVRLTGYSRPNATGELVAFATTSIPTLSSSNPFNSKTVSISYPGIRSVEVIGGTPLFPNSVFYDNIAASPSPLGNIELSKALEFIEWGTHNTVNIAGSVATEFILCTNFPPSCPYLTALSYAEMARQALIFQRIWNDPPDPEYLDIFSPVNYTPINIPESPLLPDTLESAGRDLLQQQANIYALAEAWLVTLERYNAAVAAGDTGAADLQQKALENYILAISRAASGMATAINEFSMELQDNVGEVAITPDSFEQIQSNLASNGFNSLQLDVLNRFGLSEQQLNELQEFILTIDPNDVTGSLGTISTTLADSYSNGAAFTTCTENHCRVFDEILSTPNTPFVINFDYLFGNQLGTLDVLLNNILLASLDSSEILVEEIFSFRTLIEDPVLLGLEDVYLSFVLNDPSQTQIIVQNINITDVSEPDTLPLFAASLFLWFLFFEKQPHRLRKRLRERLKRAIPVFPH